MGAETGRTRTLSLHLLVLLLLLLLHLLLVQLLLVRLLLLLLLLLQLPLLGQPRILDAGWAVPRVLGRRSRHPEALGVEPFAVWAPTRIVATDHFTARVGARRDAF